MWSLCRQSNRMHSYPGPQSKGGTALSQTHRPGPHPPWQGATASAGDTHFKLTSETAHNPHNVLALLHTCAALCDTPKHASAAQLQLRRQSKVDSEGHFNCTWLIQCHLHH